MILINPNLTKAFYASERERERDVASRITTVGLGRSGPLTDPILDSTTLGISLTLIEIKQK